jgi:3-oxoacyl-[acyl-carrier protein] reductase
VPKNAVAIVTGASQGIGRATAIRLARDFSGITLVARNTNRLLATANEVRAQGAEALVLGVDLSDPRAPVTVVDDTIQRFGRIDALLNIAGAVPQVDLFDMSDEAWESGMALKLHGARRLALRAWDRLRASKGSVVFMSGDSAQIPKAAYAAVGTINAAIVALSKAFADRGMTDGVQVNSVLPGPIMTDRRKSYLAHWAPIHNVSLEEASKEFLARTGVGRYGTPEEIAELIAFLVSPQAHWMTGSAIRMDGGEVAAV